MTIHAETDPAALQAQGFYVLQVLDRTGDLTLTWNPDDPDEVAEIRVEVERLKAAGYTFFAVVGATGTDPVDAGAGTLIVRHVSSPLDPPADDELPQQPETPTDPLCGGKTAAGKPCGRKAGLTGRCWQHPLTGTPTKTGSKGGGKPGKPKAGKPKPGRRSVAMRPMRGG